MSEYCKIKGYECGLSLGENKCVMDKPCNDIAKWITEHDSELLDKMAEKIKAEISKWWFKSELDMGAANVNCLIDEVIEEMKSEVSE